MAALAKTGVEGSVEVPGRAPSGEGWTADVLFRVSERTVAIELQRSYQHFREFSRRQERYAASGVECYWLVRQTVFSTLQKSTKRLLLSRDYGNVFPSCGIGTGMLPELPVAILETESQEVIRFGVLKSATVEQWVVGILSGTYQYRTGSWNLG